MYNIGTVTTTANSPKITGTGTRWKDNSTLVSVGQIVLIENGSNLLINSIYSIESNTALTLAFPVSAILTNAKYIILTTMIDSISDGVNKATAQVIASEVYTEILNQWMTAQGTIDVELPTGQKIKLRTVAEMDKQLDGKFDKKGGDITGRIDASSVVTASQITARTQNSSALQLNPIDSGPRIEHRKNGGTWYTHTLPDATGTLLQQGDFGIGSGYGKSIPGADYDNIELSGFYGGTGVAGANPPPGQMRYGGVIAAFRYANEGFIITAHRNEIAVRVKTAETGWGDYFRPYTDKNTTKDANGNLKAASPIIRVFADHVDPNEEAEGVTLKKLHTGIYQLHGVLGLHSDASWGGINGGITIPCGINQLPLVYALYDVLEKGEQHPFDGRIVEPDEDGDIVLYTTYRKHDLPQNIQYERFKLYPEFLKEVDGGKGRINTG